MKIAVKRKHSRKGIIGNPSRCAIALAIKDVLTPLNKHEQVIVEVHPDWLRVSRSKEIGYLRVDCTELSEAIKRFDRTGEMKTLEFDLSTMKILDGEFKPWSVR